MTTNIAANARILIEDIQSRGGALNCVKTGMQQRMIHESAWKSLNSIESGEMGVVGVNIHNDDERLHDSGLKIDSDNTKKCIQRINSHRSTREEKTTQAALDSLRHACIDEHNVMESLIAAAKAGATIGEMNGVMREIFGTWVSPSGV